MGILNIKNRITKPPTRISRIIRTSHAALAAQLDFPRIVLSYTFSVPKSTINAYIFEMVHNYRQICFGIVTSQEDKNDQIQEKNTYIYDNMCYINDGCARLLHGGYTGG